jgi:hypothetical protein
VNLELIDGGDREIQRRLAQAAAGRGDSIDQKPRQILLDSIDDDSAVGMADLQSGEVRDGGARSLGGAREQTELEKIAAIQWQIAHVFLLDESAELVGGRLP